MLNLAPFVPVSVVPTLRPPNAVEVLKLARNVSVGSARMSSVMATVTCCGVVLLAGKVTVSVLLS